MRKEKLSHRNLYLCIMSSENGMGETEIALDLKLDMAIVYCLPMTDIVSKVG